MNRIRPSWTMTLCGVVVGISASTSAIADDPQAEQPLDSEASDPEVEGENEAEIPAPPSDLESRIRIVQQRAILKRARFELVLSGGASNADIMHEQVAAGVVGRFHLSEAISFGASWSNYFVRRSEVFETVTRGLEVFPELSTLRWYAGVEAAFVMLDGKFKFFEAGLGYWDLQAFVGGGVTATSLSDGLPTAMVGAGLRCFLTPWLALTLEVRDHLYVEAFQAGDRFVNNLVGQGGLAVFVPFGFDYSFPK